MRISFADISFKVFCILVVFQLLSSCSIKKHLADDEFLYGGATVKLEDESKFVYPAKVKNDLVVTSRPKPVAKSKLWFHFNFGNPNREKGLSNWIQKSLGDEPVYFKYSDIERSTLFLENYLFDRGYFSSKVVFDTSRTGKDIFANYLASTTGRYKIRNVIWPEDTIGIIGFLNNFQNNSLIKRGQYYSVENLTNERLRLENIARNRGYYLFDQSDIFYFVDSTVAGSKNKMINSLNSNSNPVALENDIWIKVKSPEDSIRHQKFFIGETHVFPNYDLSISKDLGLGDTIKYKGLTIYQNSITLKPKVLRNSIAKERGDLYQVGRENITLNHLLELGIFKFVNQDYKIERTADSLFLNRYLYLTPTLLQGVSGELELSTQAGNFGVFLKGNYSHKNLFNGAERLDASLGTGFQLGGKIALGDIDTVSNTLYEIQGSAELLLPRFLLPFVKIKNTSSTYTPKTKIGLSSSYQRRPNLFTLFNSKLSFGYDWRETSEKRHEVTPFNLNVIRVTNLSATFLEYLDSEKTIRRSFENQLIFGPTYQYTYTNQEIGKIKNYAFFRGKLETALGLFNPRFSQFISFDSDFRYNIQKLNRQYIFRFAPSIAVPYGQSEVIPYARQFYVGGANSIRAFPIRSLLGSFIRDPDMTEQANTSFDQVGDIKLELNAEYRFDLYKALYLKGAFFVDAGNTWLLDKGTGIDQRKVFKPNEFLSEMAIGAGFGLRFDIQFIVLRFDFALPIRKPFLAQGDRWTFNRPRFMRGDWILENLSFNLGVGYPF